MASLDLPITYHDTDNSSENSAEATEFVLSYSAPSGLLKIQKEDHL